MSFLLLQHLSVRLQEMFEKAPVGEVTPIGSEEELVKIFGKPNSNNFETFFTAANFFYNTQML